MPERRPVDTRGFDTFKRLSTTASIVNLSIPASLASVRCTYMTRGMRYRRYRGFIYAFHTHAHICTCTYKIYTCMSMYKYVDLASRAVHGQPQFYIAEEAANQRRSKIRLNRRDTRNLFPLRPTRRDTSIPRSGPIAGTREMLSN